MKNLEYALKQLAAGEAGATSIEYALVGTLIAVVCLAMLVATGTNVNDLYIRICSEVTEAISGAPAC